MDGCGDGVGEEHSAPCAPNSEPAASPSTFSRLASAAPSLWAQMPSSGFSLGWAPTPACELVAFAWLLPPCCCPRWVRTRGEPTSPAPRPASPPLLMSAFFSVLVTSTICRSIDDNPPNSTERRPPGGKTRKKSQTEDRPPDLDHDTPHANQRAGVFIFAPHPSPGPPAYMLHRTREKASPAGTYSPGEPIRPPSAPPQARLPTYMRSSPTARNPTTQPSQKRGFRSKLITVSLPRLPPLRNNTAVLKPPPGTRARSAEQAIARDTLPMGHQPSQRAHQAHRRICRRTRHHCGGEEEATHTAAGWTAAEKRQVKTPSGIVPRCFGCSGPRDSFQTRCSLFFLLACCPVAVVCVSLTCVVLEVTSYPPVVSFSQFRWARVRPSLARSLGNLAKPPTHSPTSPSRSLRSDSPPGLFASMGGAPLFPPAFRSTLVGTRR